MDAENSTRPRVGRPESVDDATLEDSRNHLVWLLEISWGEVGWNLRTVKTAADVRCALQAWDQEPYRSRYVVETLLRFSERAATAKALNERRRRLGKLNETVRNAHESLEKCWESFERAIRVPATQLSQGEQEVLDDEIKKRAQTLAHAGAEYLDLRDRRENLERLLRDGEAYFARGELVRFCKSRRYRINPLNTANALAGLPFLGWRQSAKRCRKWKCPGADGMAYQAFKIIYRIVNSCTQRSELIKYAEQWLRARRGGAHRMNWSWKSHAISELRWNWYYLRRSIQTVLNAKPHPGALPYMITSGYLRRTARRSAVDVFFEEDERIVP
jgi:hypothetical protein